MILGSIRDQGKLTPELEAKIVATDTKQGLEDLYLPYRPKRRTLAAIAREAGLEPLALKLFENPGLDPETEAVAFVSPEKNVPDVKAALNGARDIADRIFVENVPSARNFLDTVMEAMRSSMRLRFTYHPFTRSKPTPGIVIEPYFLKIFRQRWYVTGRNVADRKIKTYALDRMTEANVDSEPFEMPADFSPADYTRDSFGIIFDEGRTAEVRLRAEPRKAKYLRALQLHPSQQEMVHDSFSVFTYRLKLTGDLVDELMSHPPDIDVMSPPELRAMMRARLASGLDRYKS